MIDSIVNILFIPLRIVMLIAATITYLPFPEDRVTWNDWKYVLWGIEYPPKAHKTIFYDD